MRLLLPLLIIIVALSAPSHAADYASLCEVLTREFNALILSDEDAANDQDAYGADECICEIELVRREAGDEQAEKFAQYSLMALRADIKSTSEPGMSDVEFMSWMLETNPDFVEMQKWFDHLMDTLPQSKTNSILSDPLDECWE